MRQIKAQRSQIAWAQTRLQFQVGVFSARGSIGQDKPYTAESLILTAPLFVRCHSD